MSDKTKSGTREGRAKLHDEMTAVVKDIVAKEKSLQDAKTARLRKLRAARDTAAKPKKRKPAKKAKR